MLYPSAEYRDRAANNSITCFLTITLLESNAVNENKVMVLSELCPLKHKRGNSLSETHRVGQTIPSVKIYQYNNIN